MTKTGVQTTADLAMTNAAAVVRLLRESGPLSRAELSRRLNTPKTSITAIGRRLIDSGLVVELSPVRRATAGKPALPLWLARDSALVAAISVDATRASLAIANLRGEFLDACERAISPDITGGELGRLIADEAESLMATRSSDVLGVGIALPAATDRDTGEVIMSSQLPHLRGIDVGDVVAQATGRPVITEEDGRATALGELWYGVGRERRTFLSLIASAGLGAGVIVNGSLYEGERRMSIEAGHTCVDSDGDLCSCGLIGCWETMASTDWLVGQAARRGLGDLGATPVAELGKRLADKRAATLLSEYTEHLAIGMANLAQTFAVSTFVIHGEAADGGTTLLASLQLEVSQRVQPSARTHVDVIGSPLGPRAGVLGAAAALYERVLSGSVPPPRGS